MVRNNPKGLLLSINFGSAATTLALLQNVFELAGSTEVHAVIVDNASTDKSALPLRRAVSNLASADLIELPQNRGYFGAARFAMDSYLASGRPLPEWTIVCNNDVSIADPQFLEKLWKSDPSRVGVIAPRIQSIPLGLEQNPFMRIRPKRARQALIRSVASSYPLAAGWDWLSRVKNTIRSKFDQPTSKISRMADSGLEPIYAAHGAFMIFSRQYFEKGGFFDSNLFLYGEEISVAEICAALGLSVVFDPRLVVLHSEHLSTGNRLTRASHENLKYAIRYISAKYWGAKKLDRKQMIALSSAQAHHKTSDTTA